jgi:hypothetical protein
VCLPKAWSWKSEAEKNGLLVKPWITYVQTVGWWWFVRAMRTYDLKKRVFVNFQSSPWQSGANPTSTSYNACIYNVNVKTL